MNKISARNRACRAAMPMAQCQRRLRLLLDAHGYKGPTREVPSTVQARIAAHIADDIHLAAGGDPLYGALVDAGSVDGRNRAMAELSEEQALWALDD